MRSDLARSWPAGLCVAGLAGLVLLGRSTSAGAGDLALGNYWLAWAAAPVCLLACWIAIPWMVRLQGGGAAIDADMRTAADEAAHRSETGGAPTLLHSLVDRLVVRGARDLSVRSPRRRYAHLGLMPVPALLLLSILGIRGANSAFAGPYEDVQCAVTRSWRYQGRTNVAFTCSRSSGEALEEGMVDRPFPFHFVARARPGGLGVWLLDQGSVRGAR